MSLRSSSPRLILASTSPRRRQLLVQAGIAFKAISPGIDDAQLHMPSDGDPRRWVIGLAYLKACSLGVGSLEKGTLILAADTIVVKHGQVIGQPRNEEDASTTLRTLEGGSHQVMSGVALVSQGKRVVFVDCAKVCVGTLGSALIDPYLASGLWRGKAGAYNLYERIEDGWPITYKGDPTTIMGLPMKKLLPMLERYGIRASVTHPNNSENNPSP